MLITPLISTCLYYFAPSGQEVVSLESKVQTFRFSFVQMFWEQTGFQIQLQRSQKAIVLFEKVASKHALKILN